MDHGVTAVGYGVAGLDVDGNGLKYYKIKNSWGHGWGEDGYIRFRRDYDNMCAVARKPYYPLFQ